MDRPKEIIYFSCIPWNYSWHRQQEMMQFMAENGYRVLFVEPCAKNKPFSGRFVREQENLWCLRPCGLPYERCMSPVHKLNSLLSRRAVRTAMDELDFQHPIIWVDRVHGWDFPCFQKDHYVIYDLVDDLLAFGRIRNEKLLVRLENRVLKRADLLISSSRILLERKIRQSGRQGKSFFLPNGVDCRRFEQIPEKKAGEGNPFVLGFAGEISRRRLNYALIGETAALRPEWKMVFAGPGKQADKQALRDLADNVTVLDSVSGEGIPELLAGFDAGILPYNNVRTDMDYIFPRKVCEFLAAGKGVVSTPLKELEQLQPYVLTAETAEQIVERIEDDMLSPEERKAFVRQFDWNNLMNWLIKEIE